MHTIASAAAKLKASEHLPQSCAVSELLDEFGAVYSYNVPIYRLGLRIGLLRPIRCQCGAWVLIESKGGRP